VAIKAKFAKEFWLAGGADIVKTIAQAKLAEVVLLLDFVTYVRRKVFQFLKPSHTFLPFAGEGKREPRRSRRVSRRIDF
jgi:hypothetical protein